MTRWSGGFGDMEHAHLIVNSGPDKNPLGTAGLSSQVADIT